jgi:hypothetical protein
MNMNLRISSESSEQAKQLLFFMTPFLIRALLFHVKQNAFQETKRAHPPHIVGTSQTAVVTHIPDSNRTWLLGQAISLSLSTRTHLFFVLLDWCRRAIGSGHAVRSLHDFAISFGVLVQGNIAIQRAI